MHQTDSTLNNSGVDSFHLISYTELSSQLLIFEIYSPCTSSFFSFFVAVSLRSSVSFKWPHKTENITRQSRAYFTWRKIQVSMWIYYHNLLSDCEESKGTECTVVGQRKVSITWDRAARVHYISEQDWNGVRIYISYTYLLLFA